MKDLFQNYHRHKILKHLWILSLSFVLAISVNMFVLNGETGDSLKANILESWTSNNLGADMQIIAQWEQISFVTSKAMSEVVEIAFSMSYDPTLGKPENPTTSIQWGDITEISHQPGFSTYLVSLRSAQNINKNSQIAQILFQKIWTDTVHINMMNVNFKDIRWEQYLLSSSWTMF